MSAGGRQGLALLVALSAVLLPASPPAFAAAEGGQLTQACRGVSESLRGPCRGTEQIASAGMAACRYAGAPEEACSTPITPKVSRAAIDAYESSWVHRALGLQYDLAGDVGLRNAPWVGTHNSFNSTAEMGPTLSDTDANQQLSLIDQLRLDVRSLELDVHTFRSVHGGGQPTPVVCHARGGDEAHAGCTIEKPLATVLPEIASWLREHRDQVLLLYIEDNTDGQAGHDAATAAIDEKLAGAIYRPSGGGCQKLPLDLSRDDVLAAGKQVVIVSGCGAGAAWQGAAFDWSDHGEERPHGYTDFPACGKDFTRAFYDSQLVRYYEDSTGLTAGVGDPDDGITEETAGRLARCGVDLTGFDQLLPDDGRLESTVWSWAPGQPGAGDCAVQRADGRWEARSCAERHTVACRKADGSWTVVGPAVPASAARSRCRSVDAEHTVPRTGYEGQLLRTAGASDTWLGYRRSGERWAPLD